jgi:hypothetical protein
MAIDLSELTGRVFFSTLKTILQAIVDAIDSKLDASAYNDRFKGKYTTLTALQTAHPTASAGDYAQVDAGEGHDVVNYNWDEQDGWKAGAAGSGATDTGMLPEGSNLYFTAARVRDTLLTGVSFAVATAIVATDKIIEALGKLQAQINAINTALGGKQATLSAGANINITSDTIKSATYASWSASVTGSTPLLLGTIKLIAGTYALSANFGNTEPTSAAYLLLKNSVASEICSLTATSGVGDYSASFTLSGDTVVYFFLACIDTKTAIITGVKIL